MWVCGACVRLCYEVFVKLFTIGVHTARACVGVCVEQTLVRGYVRVCVCIMAVFVKNFTSKGQKGGAR